MDSSEVNLFYVILNESATDVLVDNYITKVVQLHCIPVIIVSEETQDSDRYLIKVFKEV